MQGAFAAPHALALFFTTNTPYLCRSKQLAHCAPMYYTKGKESFLASYTFYSFHLDYQWITQCKIISKHLTLSYTTSYIHICHSINTSSGRRTRSNGHTEYGHRGAESMMLRLIFLPPVGVLPLSRNAFSPSAWHLVCKRYVRCFFIILHCVTV